MTSPGGYVLCPKCYEEPCICKEIITAADADRQKKERTLSEAVAAYKRAKERAEIAATEEKFTAVRVADALVDLEEK